MREYKARGKFKPQEKRNEAKKTLVIEIQLVKLERKKGGGIEIEKENKERDPTSIRFYFTNHECPKPNENVLNEEK